MDLSPIVTGISPKEGPPGTRVTIRGENLGLQPNEVIGLTICESDCLLSAEWKSPNKIIARSGPGKGRGDIIITTETGGRGTCTVQFRGYHETIGPLKETAVWVEEAPLQTMTWGNRTMSHSSYHLEDPLGLSVEETEKKIPDDDLHELFPDGSGDLASQQFEPDWFLLEHHHGTSFDDLKVGYSYLKRKVERQKEGQLSFLKDNVSSVMEQMDTMFLLKEKFEEDVKTSKKESTVKAGNAIKESIKEAQKLFQDVLARREMADSTRNALSIIKRYNFLFFLPTNMEHNIKHGDYDLVISDYTRAKNLFGKSETRVFKMILEEAEIKIQTLKIFLNEKLKEMPSTLEQQKKIIRNIAILGMEGNPGWDSINYFHEYINNQIAQCRNAYIAEENTQIENSSEKLRAGPNYARHSPRIPTVNQNLDNTLNATPNRIALLEEIDELLLEFLPEFWKLGQAYFNGELHVKPDKNKQKDFKQKVMDIVKLSCNILQAAVLPHTVNKSDHWPHQNSAQMTSIMDTVAAWLPHSVRHVRSMYSALILLDVPADTLDIVAKLLFELRVYCINTQLKQVADQVKTFMKKETWQLEYDSEYGAITGLPNEFEKLVSDSLQRITESALHTEKRELPVLDSFSLRQAFSVSVNKIFMNFVQAIEVLGMISEDHDHSLAVSQLIGSPTPYTDHESSELVWEQRLLVMLSNCRYTRLVIFPKLAKLFLYHGFPPIKEPIIQSNEALFTLEKRMTDTYIELKCDPLVGTVEPSMYLGHFEWDTCLKPADLKPYAKEILTNITAVYFEVYKLVPKLLYPIISQIVETVAEELSRLTSCITRFSQNGNLQARVDIIAVREIFSKFLTPNAEMYFAEALQIIPELDDKDEDLIHDVIQKSLMKMKLQVACFMNTHVNSDDYTS